VAFARASVPAALVRDGKIGVRVPGPSPALELCRAFGGPLTATSANRSGEPAARTSAEARAALGDEVDAYVPGEAPGGPPSTVIDVTETPFRLVRAGAIRITEAVPRGTEES
jgi:L-threonylcarbamoyladenylate synthase